MMTSITITQTEGGPSLRQQAQEIFGLDYPASQMPAGDEDLRGRLIEVTNMDGNSSDSYIISEIMELQERAGDAINCANNIAKSLGLTSHDKEELVGKVKELVSENVELRSEISTLKAKDSTYPTEEPAKIMPKPVYTPGFLKSSTEEVPSTGVAQTVITDVSESAS